MATHTYTKTDTWGPYEREGYVERPRVAYAPVKPAGPRGNPWLKVEEWIASLGGAAALGWSAYLAAANYPNTDLLWQTPGPLEVCGIAALVWLHAKWRRSVRVS